VSTNSERSRTRLTRDERRSQIMDAAAEVFAANGFRGTTTKDIARASEVNEALIYQHFASKEELFGEILRSKIEESAVADFLDELPADQPIEQTFKDVASKILEIGFRDPLIQKLLIAATVEGNDDTRRLFLNWRIPFVAFLEQVIRSGMERNELREVDPLLSARAFVGLVMDCVLSCNLWSELGYSNPDPNDLVANNVPIFVRGLRQKGDER
jgi:AcrR family transcriptional regulator